MSLASGEKLRLAPRVPSGCTRVTPLEVAVLCAAWTTLPGVVRLLVLPFHGTENAKSGKGYLPCWAALPGRLAWSRGGLVDDDDDDDYDVG